MTTSIFHAPSVRRYILMMTAAVACAAAGHAHADNKRTGDVPKVVVSLAGLDLSTGKGANLLYGRIRTAAEAVCGIGESRELAQVVQARACYRSAIDEAIAQANRPMLSALHARKLGKPVAVIRSASR
ncbi:MAG: UrcA family protein [Pseudomonadota bacterium]|nr:UrcA family protein [Pseudomonadota bacterium]